MIGQTEKVETEKVKSYICDDCKTEIFAKDIWEFQEMIHIKEQGGYGSIFGDGNLIDLDICQNCFKNRLGDIVRIKDCFPGLPIIPHMTIESPKEVDEHEDAPLGQCKMCGDGDCVADFVCTVCNEMLYDQLYRHYNPVTSVIVDSDNDEILCICGNNTFHVDGVETYCGYCKHKMEKDD